MATLPDPAPESARARRARWDRRALLALGVAALVVGSGMVVADDGEPGRATGSTADVAVGAAASGEPFTDVSPTAYYAVPVEWARANGIAVGDRPGPQLHPQATLSRAHAITFRWRAAGPPDAPPSSLRDVPDGAYFAEAVDWAISQGITTGVRGGDRFAPSRPVTRAEAVTFLWRHAGSPPQGSSGFTDLEEYEWAAEAIAWARDEGITEGAGGDRFDPGRQATRVQSITMLWRAFGAPSTPIPAPAGWRLLTSDDFIGRHADMWRRYHNTYGDGNNELQCLTPSNVGVSGGTLKIEARREQVTCPNGSVRQFSAGFLGTRETGTYFPRYARYEMRAKLPHGQGIWPGFWLRHRNGASTAEVDIMEYFHSSVPGQTTSTLHLDGRANLSKRAVTFEPPTRTPGWHTWAVEIEPDPDGVRFTFLLDDVSFHSYVDTQHRWASADPQATWDMAVNVSVGGSWTGHPDDPLGYLRNFNSCTQGGTPPDRCDATGILRAQFPNTYEVDYVRVYTR